MYEELDDFPDFADPESDLKEADVFGECVGLGHGDVSREDGVYIEEDSSRSGVDLSRVDAVDGV